jgi:predicted nucleic acid-binding protein
MLVLDRNVVVSAARGRGTCRQVIDEIYVSTAIAAQADALITGNRRHFPAELLCGTVILTPAEALERLSGGL